MWEMILPINYKPSKKSIIIIDLFLSVDFFLIEIPKNNVYF